MEMESSTSPVIAKKVWKIVGIAFYMLRNGMSKSKLMAELHMVPKLGKVAGKAMGNLMLHHHSALSCIPHDPHLSFVSPREYEFSCSSTPVYPFYTARKHHHYHRRRRHYYHASDDVRAVQRVFDVSAADGSPVSLPGFGRSPAVRPLRVTDSPYPLKDATADDQEDTQVDKAAEDFINEFYNELKRQKKMANLQSQSQYSIWPG